MRYLVFAISVFSFAQSIDYNDLKNKPTLNLNANDYKFTRTNGTGASGDLSSAGVSKVVTVTPCPLGFSGTAANYYIYISEGTGTAEAVLVTGGTCTAGGATGTIIFTTVNTHTGTWKLTSASNGIQDAICALPSYGGNVFVTSSGNLYANVSTCDKTNVSVHKDIGVVLTGAFTILSAVVNGVSQEILTYSGTTNPKTEVHDSGPSWGSYANIYNAMRVVIGNFPRAEQFGSDTVAITEALVGAIETPATDTNSNHNTGVAGYARTASTQKGALGVFGGGFTKTNNGQVWGGNFLVSNCQEQFCPTETGYTDVTAYGLEVNVNIKKLVGGSTPNMATRGIYIIGASEIQTSNPISNGIEIDKLGITDNIPWKNGILFKEGATLYPIYISDGAATQTGNPAILIRPTSTSNNSASQALMFHSRSSGGTEKESRLQADADGNFTVTPGNSALLSFNDGAGVSRLKVSSAEVEILHTLKQMWGTDTASAVTMTLPAGNVIKVTGTTTINILTPNTAGRVITLVFEDALIVVSDTYNIKLNGGHFYTAANNTLTLVCDGTNWYEIGRSGNGTPRKIVSELPTCNAANEGLIRAVGDSNTVVWGATVAGGSSNHVAAYCNGTNWTVMAK